MSIKFHSDSNSKQAKFELSFFEVLIELSTKKTIFLSIPETFLSGPKIDGISLLCTNYDTGELLVRHQIARQTFIDSVSFFEDLVKMKAKYPIAISKISGPGGKDSCKVMLRSRECVEIWTRIQGAGKDQAMQRYIPSSWNISVYRCQYDALKRICKKAMIRKNNKNIYEYPGMKKNIFSNKEAVKIEPEVERGSFSIRRMDQVSCNLVTEYSMLDSKMEYLSNLIEKYYFANRYLKVLALSADWIQDPKGNFFLINVKNYQVRSGHTSLVIDRPISLTQKQKADITYTEAILKRSLSPPFYYPIKSFSSLQSRKKLISNSSTSLLLLNEKKKICSV